jgi:dienelactone hydrolase
MTTTAARPSPLHSLARLASGLRRETALFLVGIAAIALHVLDDNFLQPEPGTSVGAHLISGLVPLAVLGLVAWAYPRLPGAGRGALGLAFGVLGIAAGGEGFHYARTVGASGDDYTGLLCIAAGLLLIGLGVATLWRTRRVEGNLAWRYGRRGLLGAAGVVVGFFTLMPIGLGYVTTHTARSVVPANHLGVAYENVSFTTSDGLKLQGWYVPSKNGAAVIAFPGRNGPQKQTRMLARHGYGVLLFDRRGEGRSEGKPNAWGWRGTPDIAAAIKFLEQRPDVEPGRIGGIGLSVGGEMMLEEAARNPKLAAVVSEGAGARTFSEESDYDVSGVDKVGGTVISAIKTASIAVFSNQSPPANLKTLTPKITAPTLLIAAPNSGHGEELNRGYARAAGDNATLWEIPEASHMGGIKVRPAEYERRVVGFFDKALNR